MSKRKNSKKPYLLIDFAKKPLTKRNKLRFKWFLGGGIFAAIICSVFVLLTANRDAQKNNPITQQVNSIPIAMLDLPNEAPAEIETTEQVIQDVATKPKVVEVAEQITEPATPTEKPADKPAEKPIEKAEEKPAAIPQTTSVPATTANATTNQTPVIAAQPSVATIAPPKKVVEPAWKTIEVDNGDTLSIILKREGISPNEVAKIMETPHAKGQLNRIHPGLKLQVLVDPIHHHLLKMTVPVSDTTNLNLTRMKDHFVAMLEHYPIEKRLVYSEGSINNSLFTDGQKAGLSDGLILELSNMFGWDIDFALDLRNNDHFRVLYEEKYRDGEKMRDSNIIAAEFINNGKSFKAIRYIDDSGDAGYYTPDGMSLKKAFLRTPVKFSRISSYFNTQRNHPILHRIRAHRGVDYAAPRGTPVKAAGGGQITFAGVKNGFGNVVEVAHGSRYETLYGHLDRIASGIRTGAKVRQGETIGFVGSTGLATGPHLHYEFRIDGAHRDPLTVPLPHSMPISSDSRDAFMAYSNQIIAKMNLFQKEYKNGNVKDA